MGSYGVMRHLHKGGPHLVRAKKAALVFTVGVLSLTVSTLTRDGVPGLFWRNETLAHGGSVSSESSTRWHAVQNPSSVSFYTAIGKLPEDGSAQAMLNHQLRGLRHAFKEVVIMDGGVGEAKLFQAELRESGAPYRVLPVNHSQEFYELNMRKWFSAENWNEIGSDVDEEDDFTPGNRRRLLDRGSGNDVHELGAAAGVPTRYTWHDVQAKWVASLFFGMFSDCYSAYCVYMDSDMFIYTNPDRSLIGEAMGQLSLGRCITSVVPNEVSQRFIVWSPHCLEQGLPLDTRQCNFDCDHVKIQQQPLAKTDAGANGHRHRLSMERVCRLDTWESVFMACSGIPCKPSEGCTPAACGECLNHAGSTATDPEEIRSYILHPLDTRTPLDYSIEAIIRLVESGLRGPLLDCDLDRGEALESRCIKAFIASLGGLPKQAYTKWKNLAKASSYNHTLK